MKVELNPQETETLLELLYLGNYVANACQDDRNDRYDELEQKILANADLAVRASVAETDDESGEYVYTDDFEEKMSAPVEEFQNILFWEELITRLAEKDISRLSKLTNDEKIRQLTQREDFYEAEFEKNGLDNLSVVKR